MRSNGLSIIQFVKQIFLNSLIIFRYFSFPLIVTIELGCSAQQQKVMAMLIKKHLSRKKN